MDKVSIVVPIYKVESYLENCIKSLINQTYQNIEIILVDDGSPDKCPLICDSWKKKDKRIKVIHKQNGGLSDARNCGIDNASGNYICFVDSDDYVERTYVEYLLTANKQNKTNIAQCGIKNVDENGKLLSSIGYDLDTVISGKKMILQQFTGHDIENTVVWNRLYGINLFKKLRFPFGKNHEDEYITYKLLYNESRISIIDSTLYCYRQTNNSIMRSTFNLKRLDVLDGLKERINYFKKKKEEALYYLSISRYLSCIRFLYSNIKRFFPNEKEKLLYLLHEYKEYYQESKKYKKYSINVRIKNTFFALFPNLFSIIKK